MTEKPQITLTFDWGVLRPDMRQYKQQSIEVLPKSLTIAVEIDLTHETVANSEAILKAQLGSGKAPEPVLTVAGMRQAMEAFEKVLVDELEQGSEPVWEDADFDEDETPIDVTDEFATTTDDDWEDEVDTSEDDEDTPWEEDDEDDWS